jgi:plastocyanin
MKRRSFITFAAALLLLSACAKTETLPTEEGTSSSAAEEAVSSAAVLGDTEAPPTEEDLAAEEQIIDIDATTGAFSPSSISVNRGDQVTLRITSLEGTHGFAVTDLGIDVAVPEGETVEITLPTDTAGSFEFSDSISTETVKGTITIAE